MGKTRRQSSTNVIISHLSTDCKLGGVFFKDSFNMSGTYRHKSGATKRKEKEKREQEKTKLAKLDTYFVRRSGDEPDFVHGSDSGPPKPPAPPGSQDNGR